MCNYNGRIVSRDEFIRLKNIEKQLDVLSYTGNTVNGFDYETWPVIKALNENDWKVAPMEWGFLPESWYGKKIDTREKAVRFRKGFPNLFGKMEKGITTLNAKG